jgi:hypothetical protein
VYHTHDSFFGHHQTGLQENPVKLSGGFADSNPQDLLILPSDGIRQFALVFVVTGKMEC